MRDTVVIYKWGPIKSDWFPVTGEIVHVGLQHGDVFVWTENSTNINIRNYTRKVKLHPTGEPYNGIYHGTVVMPSGFVWHVIEGAP